MRVQELVKEINAELDDDDLAVAMPSSSTAVQTKPTQPNAKVNPNAPEAADGKKVQKDKKGTGKGK